MVLVNQKYSCEKKLLIPNLPVEKEGILNRYLIDFRLKHSINL